MSSSILQHSSDAMRGAVNRISCFVGEKFECKRMQRLMTIDRLT